MSIRDSSAGRLDWLLDQLVERATGTTNAVVLATDGLLLGKSAGLSEEEGEHLSAVASAFQSLARGAGQRFHGGKALQTVVEMENAYLLVTDAGNGASLAVLTEGEVDVGLIAYEMNAFVNQVGSTLETTPRAGTHATSTSPVEFHGSQ